MKRYLKRIRNIGLHFCMLAIMLAFQNCAPFNSLTPTRVVSSPSFGNGILARKCKSSADDLPVQMGRINNQEYINIVKDRFNVTLTKIELPVTEAQGMTGFTNEITELNRPEHLSDTVIRGYFNVAKATAEKIMAQNPASVLTLVTCNAVTDGCLQQLTNNLARRVFRRPLSGDQGDLPVMDYVRLMKANATTFTAAAEVLLTTMLASPGFLYKSYGSINSKSGIVELDQYELANRLAFFVWGSGPDEALLNSNLNSQTEMDSQIDRMLADPRAGRLATYFAGEWFNYSAIVDQDLPSIFGVKQNLRQFANAETANFLSHVFRNSKNITDLYGANYSFLNQDLASFYGISGVTSPTLTKVDGIGPTRNGLLGQMSFLATTSGGDSDTHPILRGLWLATNVLCIDIDPAPKGAQDGVDNLVARTPREFASIHASTTCKRCHGVMEPLGFGLENFNAVGQWQTKYEYGAKWGGKNIPVDAEGYLNGEKFSTAAELKAIILKSDQTHQCIARKIVEFSLARKLEEKDVCLAEKIGEELVTPKRSFKEIVRAIASSDSFRRGKKK